MTAAPAPSRGPLSRTSGLVTAAAALVTAAVALAGCGASDLPSARQVQVAVAVPEASPTPSAQAGGLVPGFPDVVPVPAGSHITASAVQPDRGLLAVSVTGTSPLPVPALLSWFRTRLAASGFTATDDSLLPKGASGAAFARQGGNELLLVAVVDRGARRSWSVGGTVAPRRHDTDRG